MCGIAGYITKESFNHQQSIEKIMASFAYRGPDYFGLEIIKNNSHSIVLGHRRLSIIDVSGAGNQPMRFQDLTIVFNGEIYNYKEIKAQLEALGHSFISNSDTEVILHAHSQWKEKAVDKFIGMFAFVIYNHIKNTLQIFRDRSGIKPLYYSFF